METAKPRVGTPGEQIVEVGGYAYVWRGSEPLKVGDRVRVPGNWYTDMILGQKGPISGVVTGLGTDYRGALVEVIERA